jgi:hypothetical protein
MRTTGERARLERPSKLERAVIVITGFAVAVGAIAALSGFFAGQDQAGIQGSAAGPGQTFRDLGHVRLSPGAPHPVYDSDPPTSGAHVQSPVTDDASVLSDDQLLSALQAGDVVLVYGEPEPPPSLAALARAVAAPFTPALAAAGQAVILARRPGSTGVIALAWTHMLHVAEAADPRLIQFAQFWLGRGAPGR